MYVRVRFYFIFCWLLTGAFYFVAFFWLNMFCLLEFDFHLCCGLLHQHSIPLYFSYEASFFWRTFYVGLLLLFGFLGFYSHSMCVVAWFIVVWINLVFFFVFIQYTLCAVFFFSIFYLLILFGLFPLKFLHATFFSMLLLKHWSIFHLFFIICICRLFYSFTMLVYSFLTKELFI